MANSRSFKLWLPVIIWAAVIFALSSIPSLNSGLGGWDLILRKLSHCAEYALLALLLIRALGRYLPAFALTVAYAFSDELHQRFVRGRTGSLRDVAIDAVGAAVGLAGFFLSSRMRARREGFR